jgi:purine-binding chemotaxis protein CheW
MNQPSRQKKTQSVEVIKQYLTFRIGNENYGLELSQTREIIEYSGITEVPLMPNFLRGVINLRGEVVPVIDLAVRLGRKSIEVQKRTCIIVVELQNNEQNHVLGLLADSVSEVSRALPSERMSLWYCWTQITPCLSASLLIWLKHSCNNPSR